MDISPIFFYAFAGLAIAFALLTVLKKNPVASAFSLVMVFFSFAGIYAMLGAHLIAALQVLVYAGAIMVLFIFVIMLLNADAPSLDMVRTPMWLKASTGVLGIVLFGVLVVSFKNSSITGVHGNLPESQVEALGGNTQVVSELMFSEYILPFELTSILLLVGIVGAVAIAKRRPHKGKV